MSRTVRTVLALALALSCCTALPAVARTAEHGALTGEVIFRLVDDAPAREGLLQRLREDRRIEGIERRAGKWPVYSLVLVPGQDPVKLATDLAAHPAVRWAEPDRWLQRVPHGGVLNDPYWEQLWHLENTGQFSGALPGIDVHAVPAWDFHRGAGVVVAVLDSGVDLAHPDLDLVPGIDILDDDEDASPEEGEEGNPHGTAVAGLIAAIGNNEQGVAGVAWEAQILPVRLIGGPTTAADHWDSFVIPTDRGVAVLNNSWGFASADPDEPCGPGPGGALITDPVEYARIEGRGGLGATVVFSMGNGSCEYREQPILELPGVIAVGAVSDRGSKWNYSNVGSDLDIVAPSGSAYAGGEKLRSTDLLGERGMGPLSGDHDYTDAMAGTSGSAPLVSGVVALMYGANPRLTEAQVREVLCLTADRIQLADAAYDETGWSDRYGCGNVDAAAAVAAVHNLGPPSAPVVLAPGDMDEVSGDVVVSWSEAEDPDDDPITYLVELFLWDGEAPADDDDSGEDDDDDDDSAGAELNGPWIYEGITGLTVDVSERITLDEDYGVRVWALDRWGPGEAGETRYFLARAPVIEEQLEGQGCTCDSLSSGSVRGQSVVPALLLLLASAGCRRRRGRRIHIPL